MELMTMLVTMMVVVSVTGWDKDKAQCNTVAVNTTQETLCCQSHVPNTDLCQNNQTCITKDLDGTITFSKYCKVASFILERLMSCR